MNSKQRDDIYDALVLIIGVGVIILFAYAITAPAESVGWIKWQW